MKEWQQTSDNLGNILGTFENRAAGFICLWLTGNLALLLRCYWYLKETGWSAWCTSVGRWNWIPYHTYIYHPTSRLHATSDPSFHQLRTAQHTSFTNCYWRQTFLICCSSHLEQTTLHRSICWNYWNLCVAWWLSGRALDLWFTGREFNSQLVAFT